MHGGAPRVRHRRQTGAEADTTLQVDQQALLNTVVTSAIGGVVGSAATKFVFGDKKEDAG